MVLLLDAGCGGDEYEDVDDEDDADEPDEYSELNECDCECSTTTVVVVAAAAVSFRLGQSDESRLVVAAAGAVGGCFTGDLDELDAADGAGSGGGEGRLLFADAAGANSSLC